MTRPEGMGDRESLLSSPGNTPMPTYGLKEEFPILWQMSVDFDFAERLGGCGSPLFAEADAALRELWNARRTARGPQG